MIYKEIQNTKFCLVLSGGGALGIAQLGVIHDLEKMSLCPSEIIGTSIGSIIGACISIGMKEKEIFCLFEEFSSVFNWVKLSLTGNSIISSKKIEKILNNIFFNKSMKDTKIPLKIIATNTLNGNIKVFNSTDDVKIKDALLASMAIPGIFEEKTIDDIIYSDGFLCENLGINQSSYNDIIAVDVLGKNSFDKVIPNHFFKTKNILDMFEKSIRILIHNQTKTSLSISKNKIYMIEPTTKNYKTFHFHKYKEIRELGLGLL